MNNPKVLKTVSIVAFVISALFTIILMTSGTVGLLAYILTGSMAVILELCKCGFFYESIANKTLNLPIRVSLAVIAILLVGSSIFASAGYVQNQANAKKNVQTKESSQYKQLEQGKALQQDLYSVKKNEIEDLKKLKQQQQINGDNIVAAMPKNYIDRKNQARAETASQIIKTQELINQRSNELTGINSSLLSPIDASGLKLSNDAGYTAMFKAIAAWMGNGTNPESLEVWFYIALGVIFEIVAVLTAYLSQLKSIITYRPRENNPEKMSKPIIDFKGESVGEREIKGGRLTGFKYKFKPKPMKNNVSEFKPRLAEIPRPRNQETMKPSENSKVNEKDIQKYISYIMNNRKGDTAPGRDKIVAGTGLTQERCRTIHNILIERGYIQTGDRCTKIIRDAAISAAANVVVGGLVTAVVGGMK